MGTITSGIGLVSGINSAQIIDQLMQIESQPKTLLQTRISTNNAQKQAFSGLLTQLQTLQTAGQTLERPTTFDATTAKSSDENTLTASTTAGAPVGSYQFQVAQLVSAQQSVSNGFTSPTAQLSAGNLTIELGGGNLNSPTNLSDLNGGTGIRRGLFRITDRSGKTDVIDTTAAVTLDDVVKKINTSLDISVHASIKGDHLVLDDSSNGSGSLSVQDLASGNSAQDLGIAANTAGSTLTGTTINYLGTGTALSTLNDGRGVRTTSGSGDFTVTVADGTQITVNLGAAATVGDAVKAVNTAGGSKLKASLATGAKGVTLTDTSGGTGAFSVAAINDSSAAKDLGILKTGASGTITGDALISGIDSVLVHDLKGGAGLALGQISITDRANHTATVDLRSVQSVQDILDTINNTAGISVTASLNSAGNGIQLQDNTGGTNNLVISDVASGTTAASLGLAGTFDTTKPVVTGANLQLQWVSENSQLSTYNGGKGVTPGQFKITNSNGLATTIDLSSGTFLKLGDVINAINAKKAGVTASINANGDGLLLTDTAGGASKLKVEDLGGTTAKDLNLVGTATATTIDGSFEKTIAVASTDTLTTLQGKIQSLGFGVGVSLINDGSAGSPYHLSITALDSGRAGRVVLDGGTTGVQFRNLVDAQDSAVFLGGTGSSQPLLVTSSKNQLTGVIPGVTIDLHGASDKPVTLNISSDSSGVSDQLNKFTTTFNAVVDQITTLTKFDTDKQQGGLLLGDATVQEVQTQMYVVFNSFVAGAGKYRTLGDVGFTLTDGAKVEFDADKFQEAYAADPEAVKNLFTQATTGLGALIDKSLTKVVDPVSGLIPQENKTIDAKVQGFQDRITELDSILADKRDRLQKQFANLESVLAGLQGQQSALGSLTGLTTPAPRASTSSSSGK